MMRATVLLTAPRAVQASQRYADELGRAGCEVRCWPVIERLKEEELLPLVADVDAIVCGDDRITARVLDGAPRLRVIAKWGTGIDSIDVDEARRRGIAVCNTPGAFSEPVADTVFGYLLLFARHLDRMADDMRAGGWARATLRSLSECQLGIVGFGDSGRAVARRAKAFGMRAVANCLSTPSPDVLADFGVTMVPLERLLGESDFVTLHADMRPGNRHLINEVCLRQMKAGACLVNTARGELVDEAALVSALTSGRLAGAALDVFEEEPLSGRSPLRALPNVYLAPHNANSSVAAAERVHAITIHNVLHALTSQSS